MRVGSPGSRARSFHACAGSSTARGPRSACRWAPTSVWPSASENSVGTPDCLISQLNGWPACAPVNASPPALRPSTHDSGSGWLAGPFPCDSCIHDSLPVSRRTFGPVRAGQFGLRAQVEVTDAGTTTSQSRATCGHPEPAQPVAMEVDAVAGNERRAGAPRTAGSAAPPSGVTAVRLAARRADLTSSTPPGGPKSRPPLLTSNRRSSKSVTPRPGCSRSTATPATHPGAGSEGRGPFGRRWRTGIRCPHDRSSGSSLQRGDGFRAPAVTSEPTWTEMASAADVAPGWCPTPPSMFQHIKVHAATCRNEARHPCHLATGSSAAVIKRPRRFRRRVASPRTRPTPGPAAARLSRAAGRAAEEEVHRAGASTMLGHASGRALLSV